jgi:transcriptional regulator with XRE-family HTH domain
MSLEKMGKKIELVRRASGLSAKNLSEISGVNMNTLARYEKNSFKGSPANRTNTSAISTVIRLANALQVPPDYFVNDDYEIFTPAVAARIKMKVEIVQALNNMDESGLMEIYEKIKEKNPKLNPNTQTAPRTTP